MDLSDDTIDASLALNLRSAIHVPFSSGAAVAAVASCGPREVFSLVMGGLPPMAE